MALSLVVCSQCGANDLYEKDGLIVCRFCGSRFNVTSKEFSEYINNQKLSKSHKAVMQKENVNSCIAINDDVQRLLDKCKREPKNAKRYANLVLDIDPTNREALKYL